MKVGIFLITCSLACAQNVVSVTSTGAVSDSFSSGPQNRQAFLSAFAAAGNAGTVLVPPGTYYIDNSAGPLFITNFSGSFIFQGGSTLFFVSGGQEALRFSNATGARISGMRVASINLPSPPTGNYSVIFQGGSDITLENASVLNSGSTALQFIQSVRPRLHNVMIDFANGNGLEITNCQDAQLDTINVQNSGNDGIAILNYSALNPAAPYTGLTATNLTVCHASQSAIKVAGQSNVVIDGFAVDLARHGVICQSDSQYGIGQPQNVQFHHGVVNNFITNGIEFENPGSCSFSDIRVFSTQDIGTHGVFGVAPNGEIALSNILVVNQIAAGGGSQDAFNVGAKVLTISNSVSQNAPGAGFFFTGSGTLNASNLTAINAAIGTVQPTHNAFWFGGTGSSNLTNIRLIDTRSTPTGYIIGGSASQTGVIDGVITHLANGMAPVFSFAPNTFDLHNVWSR